MPEAIKCFEALYTQNIKRAGADALLDWIRQSDFYTAPASTRYHSSYEGGLLEHSLNVYRRFAQEVMDEVNETERLPETIAICGLLHDICKANFYKTEMRNTKNELGMWVRVPFYTVDDKFPYGHGEKSVYIISEFMELTRNEAMAIRWHMGGFDDSVKGGSYAISSAYGKYPMALLLHIADMKATYIDEVEK